MNPVKKAAIIAGVTAAIVIPSGCGNIGDYIEDPQRIEKLERKVEHKTEAIAKLKNQLKEAREDANSQYYVGLRDGAHNLTHEQMIEALEAAPVTLDQLNQWKKQGIGFGQILVRP
jgi:hypothetical protein